MQQSGPEAPAGSSMSQSVSLSKGIVFVVFPLSIQSHRQPVYVCVCGKKCSRTKKYIEKEGERTKYYLDTNTIIDNILNQSKKGNLNKVYGRDNYEIVKFLQLGKLNITYINPVTEFRYNDYIFP